MQEPSVQHADLTQAPAVPDDELRRFLQNVPTVRLRAGQTLIRHRDLSPTVYYILSGEFEILRSPTAHRSIVLGRRGVGNFLGELGVLTNQRRSADVVALTEASVAEFSAALFKERIVQCPTLAMRLMTILAEKAIGASQQVTDLVGSDVATRVYQRLCELVDPKAAQPEQLATVSRSCTHSAIARDIGSSREVVTRAFAELERAGQIVRNGSALQVRLPKE